MAIDCNQCEKLISRQLDRATSNMETQAIRSHTRLCEKCRRRFNIITGADRLLGKTLHSLSLTDGFSGTVAERLAEAHLAEHVKGVPKAVLAAAAGLGVLVVVLFALLLARSGPEIPRVGEIGRLEGRVELAYFASESFWPASMGEKIPQGAKVQTGVSSGLLKLSGGRDIAVGNETLLDLAHYHDGTKLLLKRGELYVTAADADMQVDTAGAKIYGKGAAFLVRRDISGKTTVVVESGEVSLFNPSGAVRVSAGEKAEAMEDEKPKTSTKANLKNYLDWVRQLGL